MTFDPDDQHDPVLDRALLRLVGDTSKTPPLAGDDMLARSAASAVARWNSTTGHALRQNAARKGWSRWLGGLGSGVAILGAIATTSIYTSRSTTVPPSTSTPKATTTATAAAESAPPEQSVADPMPSFDVSALPSVTPSAARSLDSLRPAPSAPSRTAAEMFAAANEARRTRDSNAPALYRDLQRAHPSSPEAVMSYVTLGRLELDRGHPAVALPQFERYLATDTVELREDALVGRATALESLGRPSDEARAWELLLAEYPRTLLAPHAKERLQTVR